MMKQVKVTTIGNSLGLILPKEILMKLHLKKGDEVYFTETPMGYVLTPYDEKFVEQMKRAEKIMHENKDVLKVLANL
ncbi:MAG: AbrB/MazE/SpoVT family DNA-binding domain-containing protein [Gammaproteobacteria bacterium]